MPIAKLSLNEMKSINKPWLTKGILQSINQSIKEMLLTENLLRVKNLHFKEIYYLEFKRYKIMINRLNRINKPKYYKTFFSEHKTHSKQSWEAVRSLINVKIKSNKRITSLNTNNQIQNNPKTISDAF